MTEKQDLASSQLNVLLSMVAEGQEPAGATVDAFVRLMIEAVDEHLEATLGPSLAAFTSAAKGITAKDVQPPAKPSLTQIAEDIYECAISHDPAVRLIGNVRADQVAAVASRFLDGQLKQAAVDEANERARRSATDHWEAMSRLADLEAKAVVLAQAASAVMAEYACGGHVGPTAEISAALSKAIEPFSDLIARTQK